MITFESAYLAVKETKPTDDLRSADAGTGGGGNGGPTGG